MHLSKLCGLLQAYCTIKRKERNFGDSDVSYIKPEKEDFKDDESFGTDADFKVSHRRFIADRRCLHKVWKQTFYSDVDKNRIEILQYDFSED